jgi:putative spermidine/putrescine transport system permease protein
MIGSDSRAWLRWLALALPCAVLTAFFVLPNMLLLSASFMRSEASVLIEEFTLENYQEIFGGALYRGAMLRTAIVGIGVGLLDALLAFPLAYFLVRTQSRWKGLLIALSLAPLLASVIVRTYGWYVILNRNGAINQALLGVGLIDQPLALMPSTGAIVIGLAHALLPYAVLTLITSLNSISPNLELAAMTLGASRWRTFIHVVLPLSLPGLVGGFVLCFSIAISAYATPAILGGPATQTIATLIYSYMMHLLEWAIGAALAAALVVATLALLYLSSKLGSQRTGL